MYRKLKKGSDGSGFLWVGVWQTNLAPGSSPTITWISKAFEVNYLYLQIFTVKSEDLFNFGGIVDLQCYVSFRWIAKWFSHAFRYAQIHTFFFRFFTFLGGFLGGASGTRTCLPMQEMEEMHGWSLGGEHPLEEGMASHSSTLAWRSSWTEEPGWL